MAKQIEGVYERILACAKKEFLQMGFAEASLRVIASEAQTTTGCGSSCRLRDSPKR